MHTSRILVLAQRALGNGLLEARPLEARSLEKESLGRGARGPLVLVALLAVFGAACGEKKPARLALDPSGPFSFEKPGQMEEIKIAAFDAKNRPFVQVVPVEYSSSDESVATVSPGGTITSVGSGTAKIKATAWDLETSADVRVQVVGSVEVTAPQSTPQAPYRMRMRDKPLPIQAIVKDDKGGVVEKPKLRYRATDYCVEVSDDGVLTPLAEGKCDVIVASADKQARIRLDVRE